MKLLVNPNYLVSYSASLVVRRGADQSSELGLAHRGSSPDSTICPSPKAPCFRSRRYKVVGLCTAKRWRHTVMLFTSLPDEVIRLVFCHLDEDEIQPFLTCRDTSRAAYERLHTGKDLNILCQESVVQSSTHYDFGVYGGRAFSPSSDKPLTYLLSHCVGPKCAMKRTLFRRANLITINACFDDNNAVLICESLRSLALFLDHGPKKDIHVHATFVHTSDSLDRPILDALDLLCNISGACTDAKFNVPQRFLPAIAANIPNVHSLNIQAHSSEPTFCEPVIFKLSTLQRLKLNCNFEIPNLSFEPLCNGPLLNTIELQLPIPAVSQWIIQNHLQLFPNLIDLRLFGISDAPMIRFILPTSLYFNYLQYLYISFKLPIEDEAEFNFASLSPALKYLYLADCRWEKSRKNFVTCN